MSGGSDMRIQRERGYVGYFYRRIGTLTSSAYRNIVNSVSAYVDEQCQHLRSWMALLVSSEFCFISWRDTGKEGGRFDPRPRHSISKESRQAITAQLQLPRLLERVGTVRCRSSTTFNQNTLSNSGSSTRIPPVTKARSNPPEISNCASVCVVYMVSRAL
uniref:Uncharacterized protein n=1 Tax=Steinernema glaseri TaxID=37863 RepID=A0A1I7ZXL8_9BILA